MLKVRRDSLTAGAWRIGVPRVFIYSTDVNCCKGNDIEMESQLSN